MITNIGIRIQKPSGCNNNFFQIPSQAEELALDFSCIERFLCSLKGKPYFIYMKHTHLLHMAQRDLIMWVQMIWLSLFHEPRFTHTVETQKQTQYKSSGTTYRFIGLT